jgi:serine/threonine protein kinase
MGDIYFPKDSDLENTESITGIYIVMEYFSFTLDKIIYQSTANLMKHQVIVLIYNLLCATKFLHDSNLIHRDLKPDNILLTRNLEVRLCDFGFSRSLEPVKKKSSVMRRKLSSGCFTRFYRPPEVIIGSENYD